MVNVFIGHIFLAKKGNKATGFIILCKEIALSQNKTIESKQQTKQNANHFLITS